MIAPKENSFAKLSGNFGAYIHFYSSLAKLIKFYFSPIIIQPKHKIAEEIKKNEFTKLRHHFIYQTYKTIISDFIRLENVSDVGYCRRLILPILFIERLNIYFHLIAQ